MAQEFPKSGMTEQVREEGSKMRSDFEETVGKAKEFAQEKLGKVGESAQQYYRQGLEKARDWEQGLEGYIKEKPITAILIACGVGMLFGMLWTRRD